MQAKTLAGPEASSQKYDLLTALGCHALANEARLQRLVLRFITLVTARYNWRRGLMHVGQREIARLWSVDERTVKREMAKLRQLGWIVVESPARRGRVASYSLDLGRILSMTQGSWARVGEDFDGRMTTAVAGRGTVVPFPGTELTPPPPDAESATDDPWGRAREILRAEDPAVFANWFEPLAAAPRDGGLELIAPSAFHASHIRARYGDRLRGVFGAVGVADFSVTSAPPRP